LANSSGRPSFIPEGSHAIGEGVRFHLRLVAGRPRRVAITRSCACPRSIYRVYDLLLLSLLLHLIAKLLKRCRCLHSLLPVRGNSVLVTLQDTASKLIRARLEAISCALPLYRGESIARGRPLTLAARKSQRSKRYAHSIPYHNTPLDLQNEEITTNTLCRVTPDASFLTQLQGIYASPPTAKRPRRVAGALLEHESAITGAGSNSKGDRGAAAQDGSAGPYQLAGDRTDARDCW
jgi:hypothetical protein